MQKIGYHVCWLTFSLSFSASVASRMALYKFDYYYYYYSYYYYYYSFVHQTCYFTGRCTSDLLMCVVLQLIEFLSDQNELAAADVLVFVREATQRFEQLRPVIVSKLLDTLPSIKSFKYVKLSAYNYLLPCRRLYTVFRKKHPLTFLPRDATQSAVLLWQVVCPSVCPSVCLSVCP